MGQKLRLRFSLRNKLSSIRFLFCACLAGTTLFLVSCTEPLNIESKIFQSSSKHTPFRKGDWSNLSPVNVAAHGDVWNDIRYNLQLSYKGHEKRVQYQINWLVKNPQYLVRALKHSAPYIFYIYQETQHKKLPAELALLPILESGFDPFEYSKVGAVGLWQMMPGTASGFGMKIDWWYDARRDVVVSTQEALRYLNYLYDYFDHDWLLAIAAYNSGEGTVRSAIRHNRRLKKPTDFWSLKLPHQTQIYVIRLLAVAEVLRSADHHGLVLPAVSDSPFIKKVDVGSQIDLQEAANLAEVNIKVIRALNPGFRRFATDPDGPYSLLIPISQAKVFTKNLAKIRQKDRLTWDEHVVRKGETLSGIAHKYHIRSKLITQVNNLKHQKYLHVNQTLLIPIPTKSVAQNKTKQSSTASKTSHKTGFKQKIKNAIAFLNPRHRVSNHITEEKIPGPKRIMHIVTSGESLASIAKHNGVTIAQIKFWNQLNIHKPLKVGQEILIWKKHYATYHPSSNYRTYKVASGDNLLSIAHHFHVPVHKLAVVNHLKNANRLKIGQRIKVPVGCRQ